MSTQEPAERKLSQIVRHEIVISKPRARLLRVMLAIVAAQALVGVVFFGYVWLKISDVDTDKAHQLTVFIKAFALPVCVLLLTASTLGFAFAPRRNATFRMILTFAGLLMVMGAALLRGNPIGIALTIYGLVLVALGYWPDKALKAEREADESPGFAH